MKKLLLLSLLFIQPVFAEYITNDIIGGCNGIYEYRAVLALKQITCSSGYYLPANALSCELCPSGYTCNGGTYDFNADNFSGATYSTVITNNMNNICAENAPGALRAVFQPKRIICSDGYYLPANAISCTKCPADNYCPGGTFTFNETTPQGIISCPENHPFAPAGMWQQSQCGRKLHIGEDILYMHQSPAHPTTHRLFIGNTNGIYSANTIQRDMNSNTFPKMSAGAQKGLHVMIGNVEYLVCDDSVPECVGE